MVIGYAVINSLSEIEMLHKNFIPFFLFGIVANGHQESKSEQGSLLRTFENQKLTGKKNQCQLLDHVVNTLHNFFLL